jgi:hypothetical protein
VVDKNNYCKWERRKAKEHGGEDGEGSGEYNRKDRKLKICPEPSGNKLLNMFLKCCMLSVVRMAMENIALLLHPRSSYAGCLWPSAIITLLGPRKEESKMANLSILDLSATGAASSLCSGS